MQISSLHIQNFRAINNLSVEFYSMSSLIGANNCGKSTIFRAMELFFEASARVDIDDFHRKNTDEPIVIRAIFQNLTSAEMEEFGSAVVGNRLSVSREFTLRESVSPNYSVEAKVFPRFADIRLSASASEKLAAYRSIQAEFGLPPVRSAPDVEREIAAWETANADQLEFMSIRGFFGATNVANGKLKKKTSLRIIPAVRDTAEETKSGRRSAVLELLADITKQTFENRKEL